MLTAFKTTSAENSWSYQRKSVTSDDLVQTYNGYNPPIDYKLAYDARKENQIGGMIDYRMDLWDNNTLTIGYSQRRMEVAQQDRDDLWRIHGAYFEDMLAVTDKLTFNVGLRYVLTRELTYPYKDPGSAVPAYRHKIKTELWLPKFTATYRFTPDTEAFVSANRDFHYPGC
jgi:outer membrane receptor protein involved in Fe transport